MDQTISTTQSRSRSWELKYSAGILTFLFLMFWVILSLYQANPPAAVSANAPAAEFSSGRAMTHVQMLAKQPHPIGSIEHGVVRDYIFNTLATNGLQPTIQTATGVNRKADSMLVAATTQNVVARLQGTNNTKAVLLAAHYDSKPQAFGASDDGAGVAAMLETLRALKSGPPLQNDVIFLFTDGEEDGLLGANAFSDEHPWAKDVGVVLNFDARGNSGPSMMFETSKSNGWLIQEFAKAAPYPVANSLSVEVYRLLPNSTDFTVFNAHGMQGLNFAYIDGLPSYHTLLDNAQTFDERSLQHHGSYALALARQFGSLDLRQSPKPDRVYFDLLGLILVHYAKIWVLPLVIFALVLFLALVLIGLRFRILTVRGIALGCVAFLGAAVVVSVVEKLLWALIFRLRYSRESRPPGDTYYTGLYVIGFAVLAVAITLLVYNLFRKKTSWENLAAGALVWWVILMLVVSFYLPGASYLLTWPLIFSTAGFIGYCVLKNRGRREGFGVVLLLAAAIPGIVLFVPLVHNFFIGLTLNLVWLIAIVMLLQIGLLVPQLTIMTRNRKWLLSGVAALIGVGFIVAPMLMTSVNAQHPKFNSIFYALNSDTGQAVWASLDPKADEWTSKFLSAQPPRKTLAEFFPQTRIPDRLLQNTAPSVPLSPPQVDVVNDEKNGDVRTLRLRLKSNRSASALYFYIDSKLEILNASLNDERFDQNNTAMLRRNKGTWNMRYLAIPPEGVLLGVTFKASEPLKIRVVDQSYGIPPVPGITARPYYMIPSWPDSLTDTTLVSKTFTL
jgi:Peptidase family M28